jgi:hypothetical protein
VAAENVFFECVFAHFVVECIFLVYCMLVVSGFDETVVNFG